MENMEWENNDKENYDEMSTQELKELVHEGGLSPTTMNEILEITFTKILDRDAKLNELDQTKNEPSTSTLTKPNVEKIDSILKAVLRRMIVKSGYSGTMENFWESEECQDLIKSWASHVKKSKTPTDKFTPLDVFYENNKVAMQISDGLLQAVKMTKVGNDWKFADWTGRLQKCCVPDCLSTCRGGKYCVTHSPREVLLLQDTKAITPVLVVLNPKTTANPYTDSEMRRKLSKCGIKKMRGGKELAGGTEILASSIKLYEYIVKKREDNEETLFKIILRWPYQDDNHKFHHSVLLSLSLLVMIKGGATLLNSRIMFGSADMAWVKSFLLQNGVVFEKGPKIQPDCVSSSPPGVSGPINRSLPYVYLGRNAAAQYYVGVQNQIDVANVGAKASYHGTLKVTTGMDAFAEDENMEIFQSPIPAILQYVKSRVMRSKFSPEEEDEFSKMEQAAKNYETLGHSAVKIGEMLEQTYKGNQVTVRAKQMPHFEGVINIVDLKALYAFLFESSLVMSDVSQLEKGADGKIVIISV